MFDRHAATMMLKHPPGIVENETILYHLFACIYLCIKIENRIQGLAFEKFVNQCAQLYSFRQLLQHLAPDLSLRDWCWTIELYPKLESEILNTSLKFRTNLVSTAEVVYQIACTFKQVKANQMKVTGKANDANQLFLESVLEEALFRSYICLRGKCDYLYQLGIKQQKGFPMKLNNNLVYYITEFKTWDYSTAALGIACLMTSLDKLDISTDGCHQLRSSFANFLAQQT